MSFQHADVSSKSERKPLLTFELERVLLPLKEPKPVLPQPLPAAKTTAAACHLC